MDDLAIRDDVLEELRFDPRINSVHVGVTVRVGVVTLSGHVASYPEKFAAIIASRRVKGVMAVADECHEQTFSRTLKATWVSL